MQTLTIVRGLPGSGKSTYAKKLLENTNRRTEHFEADNYFIRDGEYVFDHARIKDAHNASFSGVVKSLLLGNDVIVANTFVSSWELEPYIALGNALPNVNVMVVTVTTQFESIHNVPEDVIDNMRERWIDTKEIRYNFPFWQFADKRI